jgi:hypothetical protein
MIIAMGSLGAGKMGGFGGMGGKGGKGGKMGKGGKGGKGFPRLERRQLGGKGGMGGDVKLMDEALSWVQKNAGSGKYANVDKSRVAVAGQSCGGLESCAHRQHQNYRKRRLTSSQV